MMTKPTLLSNLRIEDLNSKTDYLGIIEKGYLIQKFLLGSTPSINEIKMFALYGDWGSGKSSLMKFLYDNLQEDFNTFFFEAWEYEKDENLAMSLLEFITYETKSTSDKSYDDVLKYGGRILRGLGKSVKLNIPLFPNGPTLEIDPSAFVEEINQNEEISFYDALKKFKKEFIRLEDLIVSSKKRKYNIIFIDDLDRCEPEQILNLMSAIKLFFTYGEKTIFFCGIDKTAVQAAVRTRYGKVVKSNEYLEKIFDITFSMPSQNDLQKLVNHYFDSRVYRLGRDNTPINYRIHDFFRELNFTNPRRVKKVLNKFQILRDFKLMSPGHVDVFPNVDMKTDSEKNLFETLLVLYLIILHEFFPSEFDGFINFQLKKQIYSRISNGDFLEITRAINKNVSEVSFNEIQPTIRQSGHNYRDFWICICPNNLEKIHENALLHQSHAQMTVEKNHFDYLFYKYVNAHDIQDWLGTTNSTSSFQSVKKLMRDLL